MVLTHFNLNNLLPYPSNHLHHRHWPWPFQTEINRLPSLATWHLRFPIDHRLPAIAWLILHRHLLASSFPSLSHPCQLPSTHPIRRYQMQMYYSTTLSLFSGSFISIERQLCRSRDLVRLHHWLIPLPRYCLMNQLIFVVVFLLAPVQLFRFAPAQTATQQSDL